MEKVGVITSERIMKDIKYKNNYILGVTACSFMKDKESKADKSLIVTTFSTLNDTDIRKIFFSLEGGFDNIYTQSQDQPVWIFAKKSINVNPSFQKTYPDKKSKKLKIV